MAHTDGEAATSRACAHAGVNMAISSFSNYDITDIRSASASINPDTRHAIQLYT